MPNLFQSCQVSTEFAAPQRRERKIQSVFAAVAAAKNTFAKWVSQITTPVKA